MLLIDDEADNASINTNKPDLDPTKTNTMIRKILGLFAKSCYLGYTATPFANIFINPEAYDEEAREELFPRDFIYCLDAPNTYFGPDKVFLDEATSTTILECIEDCDDYIPFSHKKDYEVVELPPSLYKAICQFVLIQAIRNLRGQTNKHCSMMINMSRFVAVQKAVRDLTSIHVKKLMEAVKANYAMPEDISGMNKYMKAMNEVFDVDYLGCGFEWPQVKAALWGAVENLRLFVINSKTDEVLDYKKYEKDGHGLTAIAVGGLSLSRGLTIEGLCVSYMYRNTKMYDTLMQMGRWFGYRPGYEDLCRVHLSADSINWYAHIAEASEELRQQVNRMRQDRLSPRQFGLYVRAHPDTLLITAANKMRLGERVKVKQNFSGRLVESYVLPNNSEINAENEELIEEYWRKAFGGTLVPTEKGWTVQDVKISVIQDFLIRFRTHPSFVESKSAAISYLQALEQKHSVGDVLLISIKKNGEDTERFRLGTQERLSAKLNEEDQAWRTSKNRVASKTDEKLGLTPKQQSEAANIASQGDSEKKPSDFHFRVVRKKPLLMIHVLDPLGSGATVQSRIPAFGISFPPGYYDTEIEIVANRIWLTRMQGNFQDNPDDEDDFDDENSVG